MAVCQPLATTAASVTSNLATLTMASNPITAGFVSGMVIQVSGFSGGDTYFNGGTLSANILSGGFITLSVTSTQIVYALVHANASAGTNGTVLQQGNGVTGCAGLTSIYTDSTLGVLAANPSVADGLGNYGFWSNPGQYIVQLYSSSVPARLYQVSLACVPSNTVNCGALLGSPNTWTAMQTFSASINTNVIVPTVGAAFQIGTSLMPYTSIVLGSAVNQSTQQSSLATANRTATWPDASGTPSLAAVEYCGATTGATQACAKTVQTLPIVVWGDVLLNGATTQSITTLPFTDTLYSCSGSDLTTAAGVVAFSSYLAASVTIQETGGANTDHLRFMCVGH